MEVLSIVLVPALGALVGAAIGEWKGRFVAGALWGLFLGPIGWLVIAVGPKMGRKCPACMGIIPKAATACMHCGRDVGGPGDTIGTPGF